MNFRITTSSVMRNYKSKLMNSYNNLYKAQEKVLTQRQFNSYAEDPASATQAFKLRRIYSSSNDQLKNVNSLINKFESAWTSVGEVSKLVSDSANDIMLRGTNEPDASARKALGQALDANAEAIIQTLNTRYGDTYIFAGTDGRNTPFSWGASGELLYRGINVNDTNADVQKQLQEMCDGAIYVDVGSGISNNADGSLNTATAFDSSISGLSILGFGVDADGDPQNIVSMIKELAAIYGRCDSGTGEYASKADSDAASRLLGKLQEGHADIVNEYTALDGDAQFLKTTQSRLSTYINTVNEQIIAVEDCDLAEATTEFEWAKYCYQAALQAGQTVISQSLLDYI